MYSFFYNIWFLIEGGLALCYLSLSLPQLSPFTVLFLLRILFKCLLKWIPERLGHRAAEARACSRTHLPLPGFVVHFDLRIGRLKFRAPWLSIITEWYLLPRNSKHGNSCPVSVFGRGGRAGSYLDSLKLCKHWKTKQPPPEHNLLFLRQFTCRRDVDSLLNSSPQAIPIVL